jgi:hypothetical protein
MMGREGMKTAPAKGMFRGFSGNIWLELVPML